jgi:hypothetical protein
VLSVRERFGCLCCRETIRAALHRLKLSWKKAKKLLGRADPEQRQAFVEQLRDVLAGAQRDRHLLVSASLGLGISWSRHLLGNYPRLMAGVRL